MIFCSLERIYLKHVIILFYINLSWGANIQYGQVNDLIKYIKMYTKINKNYCHYLIFSGKVGGNTEFTEEMNKTANEWIKKNLSNIDIKFPVIDF